MPGLVAPQIAAAEKAVCESGFKLDGTRFAVSEAWIIVPEGGGEKNLAGFGLAREDLGLEWSLNAG